MKVIFLIFLAVIILDFLIYGFFFDLNFLLSFSAVFTLILLYLLRRWFRSTEVLDSNMGFMVGHAVDVTNPDKPTKVINANIPKSVLNLGTLVIGSQGSGKTESALLGFTDAQKDVIPDSGHAIFEGKGDIDIYKKYVVCNRKPDNFFSTELAGSDTLNLFQGDSYDVIERMSYILIGTTTSTSFFSDNQRDVLMRVIPLLKAINIPTNLRDLYVVLSVEDAGNAIVRLAKSHHVASTIIHAFETWLNADDHVVRYKEIKGLLNRLFVFVNSPYSARLNAYQPDIDVGDIIKHNKRVYFHMPYTEFSVDVSVAITEMFAVESRKRQLSEEEHPTLYPIFFDDWGKFFYKGFSPFQARCRSANMPLLFSFQSYAQLEEVSPTFAEQLDDMTATKIILRCLGEKTGTYAIRLIGEYERFELAQSELGARDSTSLQSRSTYRLSPRDLKSLQAGEAYITTLITKDNETQSPLWKTRLRLPDFTGWRDVSLPIAKLHTEGEGLGFWDQYMNPEFVKSAALEAEESAAQYKTVIL